MGVPLAAVADGIAIIWVLGQQRERLDLGGGHA
jgi:hypothetical protein